MDDDDFGYDYQSDNQNDFDQEEDKEETQISNLYYEADDLRNSNPEMSIQNFRKVIDLEKNRPKQVFTFKSYLSIIVINAKMQKSDQLSDISYIIKIMDTQARNDQTEAINQIIDALMKLTDKQVSSQYLEDMIKYFKQKNLEQLHISTSQKLMKKYLENQEYGKLEQTIEDIKKVCFINGQVDEKKNNLLLEIYSNEIQLCIYKRQNNKLKKIIKTIQNLSANTLNDSKITAIISETKGKMMLQEHNYSEANNELLNSFKSYQESGNSKAKQILKYVVVASILSKSVIDPFSNQEAVVYKNDPEIAAIQKIRTAFDNKEIAEVNRVLNQKQSHLLDDEFLVQFIDEIKKLISLEKIQKTIVAYKRIKLAYLAQVIQTSIETTIKYLMELIIEKKINGYINHPESYFENYSAIIPQNQIDLDSALENWLKYIQQMS